MIINYERQMRCRKQTSFYFEGDTLKEILKTIEGLIQQYGEDVKIMSEVEPDSDKEYFYVFTKSPETDDERAKRIALEEKYVRLRETIDAAEFKRLQAKFGAK